MQKVLVMVFWLVGLGAFFLVGSPYMDKLFPDWARFNEIQEVHGVDNAHLYYTDLPIIQDAEAASRAAVREGMQARREAAAAKRQKAASGNDDAM
ncbi:MAG: hypothetical protein IJA79_03705 [Desulfovibrio sp.]|nr:hypothetical protein [Desulfovibrio sp.]